MPIKFLAGSPVTVTFKFDKGMEKEGQWGKYYSYGVTYEGKEDYMSVSEGSTLLSYLNSISPLKGKTVSGFHVPSNLQILTAHENNKKNNRYEIS